jgi:hypothetical protein
LNDGHNFKTTVNSVYVVVVALHRIKAGDRDVVGQFTIKNKIMRNFGFEL